MRAPPLFGSQEARKKLDFLKFSKNAKKREKRPLFWWKKGHVFPRSWEGSFSPFSTISECSKPLTGSPASKCPFLWALFWQKTHEKKRKNHPSQRKPGLNISKNVKKRQKTAKKRRKTVKNTCFWRVRRPPLFCRPSLPVMPWGGVSLLRVFSK